jgi:hypothetical protein
LWTDLTTAKRWTGSTWVDIFTGGGGGPPPGAPVADWVNPIDYEQSFFDCDANLGPCPVLKTFTINRDFTASGHTSIVIPPISGITASVAGMTATFTTQVGRNSGFVQFFPVVNFVNASGTTPITFQWDVEYLFIPAGGGETP